MTYEILLHNHVFCTVEVPYHFSLDNRINLYKNWAKTNEKKEFDWGVSRARLQSLLQVCLLRLILLLRLIGAWHHAQYQTAALLLFHYQTSFSSRLKSSSLPGNSSVFVFLFSFFGTDKNNLQFTWQKQFNLLWPKLNCHCFFFS